MKVALLEKERTQIVSFKKLYLFRNKTWIQITEHLSELAKVIIFLLTLFFLSYEPGFTRLSNSVLFNLFLRGKPFTILQEFLVYSTF